MPIHSIIADPLNYEAYFEHEHETVAMKVQWPWNGMWSEKLHKKACVANYFIIRN